MLFQDEEYTVLSMQKIYDANQNFLYWTIYYKMTNNLGAYIMMPPTDTYIVRFDTDPPEARQWLLGRGGTAPTDVKIINPTSILFRMGLAEDMDLESSKNYILSAIRFHRSKMNEQITITPDWSPDNYVGTIKQA